MHDPCLEVVNMPVLRINRVCASDIAAVETILQFSIMRFEPITYSTSLATVVGFWIIILWLPTFSNKITNGVLNN